MFPVEQSVSVSQTAVFLMKRVDAWLLSGVIGCPAERAVFRRGYGESSLVELNKGGFPCPSGFMVRSGQPHLSHLHSG